MSSSSPVSSYPNVLAGDFNENNQGYALEQLRTPTQMKDALEEFVPKEVETHRCPLARGRVMLRKRLDQVTYLPSQVQCLGCGVLAGFQTGASDYQPVLARFVKDQTKTSR